MHLIPQILRQPCGLSYQWHRTKDVQDQCQHWRVAIQLKQFLMMVGSWFGDGWLFHLWSWASWVHDGLSIVGEISSSSVLLFSCNIYASSAWEDMLLRHKILCTRPTKDWPCTFKSDSNFCQTKTLSESNQQTVSGFSCDRLRGAMCLQRLSSVLEVACYFIRWKRCVNDV